MEIGLLLHVSLESLTFNWTAAFCSDISMSNVSRSGLYDDPLTSQGDGDFHCKSLSLFLLPCWAKNYFCSLLPSESIVKVK